MSRHKNAVVQMPNMQELGGHRPGIPAFVRVPIYPTAPYVSTRQDVGIQPRFYGATLASGDADYLQNSESIRIVNFDIPCVLFARAGGAFNTGAGNALPIGVSPLDTFLFRMEYSTGDKLDTGPRMASTCLGTMQNPGEVGGEPAENPGLRGMSVDQVDPRAPKIVPQLQDREHVAERRDFVLEPRHEVHGCIRDGPGLVVEAGAAAGEQLHLEALTVVMAHAVKRVLLRATEFE